MDKVKSLKTLLYDTYTKCFGFLGNDKNIKEYQKIDFNQAKVNEEEHNDEHADWSTQESIYQTQSDRDKTNTPPESEKKKPVLIGNLDEDSGVKKFDIPENDDDLFQDVEKPSFNQKIQNIVQSAKKVVKSVSSSNSKPKSSPETQKTAKFSMDEELEAEDGWGEDTNLELN